MTDISVNNIIPLAGYILVEPVEGKDKTASGIYLPSAGEEKPQIGIVISISDEFINEHGNKIVCPVKKGDTVIYKKWGGNEVKLNDRKEAQLLKFEDIIAKVKTK